MAIDNLLTVKQQEVLQSYLHDDWRVLILSGAVRAGKTYISDWIFLLELRRVARLAKAQNNPHPVVILAGYSSNSIYTNVIVSIENEFGVELKPDRHGHYHLFGVDIVPAYTGNKRGMSAIRGATAYSAYIDEGSLADQSVFQEILQRCSIEGSRIIVTTNPGSPVHYLKTDYIDNTDPEARIKTFNFTIDDNTWLSPEYVTSLKAQTPSGMFTDRAIYGLWVSGEGLVYRDFDKNRMMIDKLPPNRSYKYYCGIDFGFAEGHDTSITVWADDEQGNTYLVEEHTAIHKYIDYWMDVIKDIQKRYGYNLTCWADPARPEYVSQLLQNGIQARNANKTILTGIEAVSKLMTTGHFYVLKGAPVKFLNEIYEYVWDKDKGVPVKKKDNCMDSMRYAIFNEHLNNDAQFINSVYI
jgi:PBSX family phage terminase large subunit